MGRSWSESRRVVPGVIALMALAALVIDGRAQVKTGNDIGAITGATHTAPTPPAGKPTNRPDQRQVVKDIADKFKGTHDLAGAAEELVKKAGNQFKYHYGDPEDPQQAGFEKVSSLDELYAQRLMICYEFVHYVAFLAGNQNMAAGTNPKIGASSGQVVKMNSEVKWDRKSEIPRGKIVIFKAYAFNNNSGYYHVGISLGGGKIAHNSSEGNMQISDIKDVDSWGYKEVDICDYEWKKSVGDPNPGDPVTEPEPVETIKEFVPPEPPAKSVGQLPEMQKALDDAPQGIHLADNASCCGDPLGEVMIAPTLAYAPQYQLFVTGEPLDIVIGGGDTGGKDEDRWVSRASRGDGLLASLLRGIVATLEARQRPARVGVAVVATGESSGNALMVQITGPLSAGGRVLASDGLVLQATTQTVAMPKPSPASMARGLEGFCAEFVKEPPPPGTIYKVADAKQQQRLKPMRRIMRAANQLATSGKLHPDSSLAGYATSIKQYAVWTRIEGWNRDAFFKHFLERTKKNALALKQPWTDAVEAQVKTLLPNRWDDIQAVLKAGDALPLK